MALLSEPLAADATLDDIRALLAPRIAAAAVFDGWTDEAVQAAAGECGIDPAVASFAFPSGAMDMIEAWVATVDTSLAQALPPEKLAAMKVRERIRAMVLFRLECTAGLEEALRRALAIEAMPQNLPRTLRMGWSSADLMWRLAGDTATDYNHYTKRTLLAAIYAATLAVFLDDDSADKAETQAFLDRRIDGVMRFEKAKARWTQPRESFSVTRFLGRLRYPAR